MLNWLTSSRSINIPFRNKNLVICSYEITKKTNEIDITRAFSNFIGKLRSSFSLLSLRGRRNCLFITICRYKDERMSYWKQLKDMQNDFKSISNAFLPCDLEFEIKPPSKVSWISPQMNIQNITKSTIRLSSNGSSKEKFVCIYEFSNIAIKEIISSELINGILEIKGAQTTVCIASNPNKNKFSNYWILELIAGNIVEIKEKEKSIFAILKSAEEIKGTTNYLSSNFIKKNPGANVIRIWKQ